MRYGITASLVLLLTVLVIVSQSTAYFVTSTQLTDAVREREIDKIKTISNVIESLLERESRQTQALAKMLSSNSALTAAVAQAQLDKSAALDGIVRQVFSGSQLDLLEITDAQEIVIYRAHDAQRTGDRSAVWGVTEALTGTSGIATTIEARGVAVRAIEPLNVNGKTVGTVMTGIFMGDKFMSALSRQAGANLALLSRSKPVSASHAALLDSLDTEAIRRAFEQKIPIYRENATTRVTRVYLPVLIVDEGFVMLAEIDSSTAYQGIQKGTQQLIKYATAILIVSILLGILLVALVMKPLRALRTRAERSVRDLNGNTVNEEHSGNEVTSVVIRAMLTSLDATITIVENGAQAVEELHQNRFDIIFLDCQMPVMNGYEATARMRQEQTQGKRIPIVALTANALADDRQQCLDAGMDDYIAKPVSMIKLRAVLSQWTSVPEIFPH